MHEVNFKQALQKILVADSRFDRHAYLFVREALDYTQKLITKSNKGEVRHVSGQELLAGIREYALRTYGPMADLVLSEWGVHKCEDFGDIVFNMIDGNLLAKTEKDTREDFKGGYTFEEAFRNPFRPARKQLAPDEVPKTSQP